MLDFLIVAICLAINAFFSAYEMAFVTISNEDFEELEDTKRSVFQKILTFKKKPERTLSVIQVGITLVGAIAAAVGGTGAVETLEPYMVQKFDLSTSAAEGISVTLVILPLTYFTVVFGELFPKTIALKHPLKILVFGTSILSFLDKGLSPIVTFLEVSTNFLLKTFGLKSEGEDEEVGSNTIEIGSLPAYHQKFVENLVSLRSKQVAKSMVPWEKVIYLRFGDNEDEVKAKMAASDHSRFPVIDGTTIVGILYKKGLFEINSSTPWEGLLRPAVKVRHNEKVLTAFLKMQERQTHIAVVTDEDEIFIGIITIEDILEEVVGDIHDKADISRTTRMLSNRSKINLKSSQ